MPELPEVEVVKRSLEKKIKNMVFKKVTIRDGNLRYKVYKKEISKIIGLRINKVTRRSKFLIFHLNNYSLLLFHLGMTGKFFFINARQRKIKTSFYYNLNRYDNKHDRLIFLLNKKQKLIYNDVRKFGFVKLVNKKDLKNNLHIRNLGPEPLEKNYNFEYFKKFILMKKRNIKNIMMDQKFISGLGNIYVNEILFYSGIKPTRIAKNLKNFEIHKIVKFTKKILIEAIELGGSSIKDFSSENGKSGKFQQHFKVYSKKGEVCSNADCKSLIKKIVISNRATFYCPKCQKN